MWKTAEKTRRRQTTHQGHAAVRAYTQDFCFIYLTSRIYDTDVCRLLKVYRAHTKIAGFPSQAILSAAFVFRLRIRTYYL